MSSINVYFFPMFDVALPGTDTDTFGKKHLFCIYSRKTSQNSLSCKLHRISPPYIFSDLYLTYILAKVKLSLKWSLKGLKGSDPFRRLGLLRTFIK